MRYSVGVDIGGTNIKLALCDKKARLRGKRTFSTTGFKDRSALIDGIVSRIEELISGAGLKKREIIGVGIGAPGAVDIRTGTVHYLTNIPDWREVPLGNTLKKRLGIPVFVDNDVNVMALGEVYFGAGKGAVNMLCITLGTGVGGGLILDGKLYRGSSYAAGEFGHIPINIDGPKCKCGSWACVEAYAGNSYIVKDVIARIRSGQKTLITKLVEGDLSKVTPEIISEAARKNDKFAKQVWIDVGQMIGIGLAGVVNLLNVEKIVIGGGVAGAGKRLFDSIKKAIKLRAMKLPAKTVKIVKAKLGYDAGLIGAATLVLYELHHTPWRTPRGNSLA
ncbi:MAG: ROK family protein [Candidatus Omnitrophica bacterium]|nr:ROK family protein [Candidatus Omnitrophota bacterium]